MISEKDAIAEIVKHRGDSAIIYTMTAAAQWPENTTGQPELSFIGSLGKSFSFGLGLALALPQKRVTVVDGDGSLLMSLGALTTIANMSPPNLVLIFFENTVWETTGGQALPGAGKVDLVGMARAAGIQNAWEFDDVDAFREQVAGILAGAGPLFVSLKVAPGGKRRPIRWLLPASLPLFKAALEKSLAS
ncbi:MAG: thiamine pyrophosphate-dependent enzyme [Chloroflexota bacterium]